MARKRLSPLGHEYVVYANQPPWRPGCKIETLRIPHGQTIHDVRDQLPASIARYAVVRALDAASARIYAAALRDVRCKPAFSGAKRRRRRR